MSVTSYWLEKAQLQAAAAVTITAGYLMAWPALRPGDPLDPLTIVGTWSMHQLLLAMLLLTVLTVLAAVITFATRPEGALIAGLAGLGGLCLRSPRIDALLWVDQANFKQMYFGLAGELLLLGVGILVAALLVSLMRALFDQGRLRFRWSDLGASLTEEERRRLGPEGIQSVAWISLEPLWVRQPAVREVFRGLAGRTLLNFAMGSLLAIIVMVILLQSNARGQILFALFGSFFMGFWITQAYLCATPWSIGAWAGPLVVGVGMYLLASLAVVSGPAHVWLTVPAYARILPIDWAAAGGSGGVLGFWLGSRLREVRLLEQQEQLKG